MDCLEQLGSDVVEGLYESCVIDIRATENEDDQKDVACDMLKMLIRECMAVGICIDPKWTDLSGCRKSEILLSLVSNGRIYHSTK